MLFEDHEACDVKSTTSLDQASQHLEIFQLHIDMMECIHMPCEILLVKHQIGSHSSQMFLALHITQPSQQQTK